MASTELKKQLRIKVGTCKRLYKDLQYYYKEESEQKAKIEAMKEQQVDPYNIKKQEEVLAETLLMIPDTKARLETALNDLTAFMEDAATQDTSIQDSAEWKDAVATKTLVAPLFE